MEMKEILNKLVTGRNLTLEETKEAAEIILGGNATVFRQHASLQLFV